MPIRVVYMMMRFVHAFLFINSTNEYGIIILYKLTIEQNRKPADIYKAFICITKQKKLNE